MFGPRALRGGVRRQSCEPAADALTFAYTCNLDLPKGMAGVAEEPTGDELLAMLSALANPWRLRILAQLACRSDYVSNLARHVGISRPLVHMHLKKLEEAGLVIGRLELSDDGKALRFFDVAPVALTITPETFARAVKTLTDTQSTGGSRSHQKGQKT